MNRFREAEVKTKKIQNNFYLLDSSVLYESDYENLEGFTAVNKIENGQQRFFFNFDLFSLALTFVYILISKILFFNTKNLVFEVVNEFQFNCKFKMSH